MQRLEGEHYVDGRREVVDFTEARCGVVGVSAVVNPSALDHEEEALVAEAGIKVSDAGIHEVGKGGIVLLSVDGIREFCLGLSAEAEDSPLDVLYSLEASGAAQDLDARSSGLGLEESGVVAGIALGDEPRTRSEIYRGVEILVSDFLIIAALVGMGDEAGRRGVVDTYCGRHARAVSGFLGPFHEVGDGIAVHVDTDCVVVGLYPRGQGGASGR